MYIIHIGPANRTILPQVSVEPFCFISVLKGGRAKEIMNVFLYFISVGLEMHSFKGFLNKTY